MYSVAIHLLQASLTWPHRTLQALHWAEQPHTYPRLRHTLQAPKVTDPGAHSLNQNNKQQVACRQPAGAPQSQFLGAASTAECSRAVKRQITTLKKCTDHGHLQPTEHSTYNTATPIPIQIKSTTIVFEAAAVTVDLLAGCCHSQLVSDITPAAADRRSPMQGAVSSSGTAHQQLQVPPPHHKLPSFLSHSQVILLLLAAGPGPQRVLCPLRQPTQSWCSVLCKAAGEEAATTSISGV